MGASGLAENAVLGWVQDWICVLGERVMGGKNSLIGTIAGAGLGFLVGGPAGAKLGMTAAKGAAAGAVLGGVTGMQAGGAADAAAAQKKAASQAEAQASAQAREQQAALQRTEDEARRRSEAGLRGALRPQASLFNTLGQQQSTTRSTLG